MECFLEQLNQMYLEKKLSEEKVSILLSRENLK
jgi:hypothetical protein